MDGWRMEIMVEASLRASSSPQQTQHARFPQPPCLYSNPVESTVILYSVYTLSNVRCSSSQIPPVPFKSFYIDRPSTIRTSTLFLNFNV